MASKVDLTDLFVGPVEVVVATAAMLTTPLFGAEVITVAGAAEKRRREYTVGRDLARTALARLGYGRPAILTAPDRSPIWPMGAVGSITHCDGFCAAAVAHGSKVRAVGLDAEPHEALPDKVVDLIFCPAEAALAVHALASPHWARLIFSAKEAFYKGFYPLTGQYLDFHDVIVEFAPASEYGGSYVATLRDTHHRWSRLASSFVGRWVLTRNLLVCGVTLPFNDA